MNLNWWKESVFYEIYMPSFMDGNGDGIGDFKGITSKLEYIKDLGIKGIWLTPFYKSPKIDNGYDIADYKSIDEDYGTFEDFKVFLNKAHRLGIKIIIDIVLNHTSSEHSWFKESRSSINSPKRNFYIWKKHKPNNWESFFGGDAWEYDEKTKEYYYHAFAKEQVDLNWMNPKVYDEIINILKFWINLGIDGFRFDVINFLTVKDNFEINNPVDKMGNQEHIFDKNQEGILEVVKKIAKDIREIKSDIFLVGEVGSEDLNELKEYSGEDLLDVVFNFNLGSIEYFSIDNIYKELKNMNEIYTNKQAPTIFFNSHDMARSTSRFNPDFKRNGIEKAIAALMLTAFGVPFIYFGEEIGMRNLSCSNINNMNDIQGITKYNIELSKGKSKKDALASANESSRDKSRGVMKWDNSQFFGFSTKEPWIMEEYTESATTVDSLLKEEDSLLRLYKRLIEIRYKYKTLLYGKYRTLTLKEDVLIFEREYNGEIVKSIINFGEKIYIEKIDEEVLISTTKYDKEVYLNKYDFIVEKRKNIE